MNLNSPWLQAAVLAASAGILLAWILHLGWEALESLFTVLRHF